MQKFFGSVRDLLSCSIPVRLQAENGTKKVWGYYHSSDGKGCLKPAGGGRRFRGRFGGRGGFSGSPTGIVTGSVSQADSNQITVDTESVGVTVNLEPDSSVQIYKTGTIDDLIDGRSVLVVTSTNDECGAPVTTTSVVINPPEFGRQFGGAGGGFGGRPPRA